MAAAMFLKGAIEAQPHNWLLLLIKVRSGKRLSNLHCLCQGYKNTPNPIPSTKMAEEVVSSALYYYKVAE